MKINLNLPEPKPILTRRFVIVALLIAALTAFTSRQALCQSSGAATSAAQSPPPSQSKALTLDEALDRALATASTYEQAKFGERIAEEDVRQAQAAFLPRFISQPTLIYTSPSAASALPGAMRSPSYIGANAITEYQGLAGVVGEADLSGRLRATLRRNRALLAAAHAGTEAERRNLILATVESYYGLGLAVARRRAADLNLNAAQEFERITDLLVKGGEVAQVDLERARLLTFARRDELEQARAGETVATEALRVLIGYAPAAPVVVTDLPTDQPDVGDVAGFTAETITQRPELRQLEAQRIATMEEAKQARSERRPQVTYSVNGGFSSDALSSASLGDHRGAQATVGVTIPLFDWGASKSRERQAQLRLQTLDSARLLALRSFNQQFAAARAQALTAIERIRLARSAVTSAERNLEISIARYRAGEAQIIEVTDAQNSLTAQRAALNQAMFDYRVALARLRQATGQ
ncbi:MAG: TolC family protein [Blastocatellales bacterium]